MLAVNTILNPQLWCLHDAFRAQGQMEKCHRDCHGLVPHHSSRGIFGRSI